MAALLAVSALGIPDCWLAAGFVRNMVWDVLHGYASILLNAIDAIFYDPIDRDGAKARSVKETLNKHPNQIREVVNQALKHVRTGDAPYKDSADTMSFRPEIKTAVGARLSSDGDLQLPAPIGIESLVAGCTKPNTKRSYELFLSRV